MKALGRFEVPDDLLYSKEHDWLKQVPEGFMVGITDFAQSELGDIAFVDVPDEGSTFKQGDVVLQLESVKAVTDVFVPLSGEIVKTNDAVEDEPQVVNESPYDKGWLFIISADDYPSEKAGLMNATAYVKFIEQNKKD
ncbi:MAG: glycine cleavage system protein GcvH [Candidatus Undinarchaeales archaeon]|jgi:glycine cleavage system H protein|nr:glycine cleavage system protein GcvH [Candidatus Undinarchaeales archaeon]MDP7492521.1 glycine cleavage system protein GcvH [Candidatus Undinarchaeales archaeon]